MPFLCYIIYIKFFGGIMMNIIKSFISKKAKNEMCVVRIGLSNQNLELRKKIEELDKFISDMKRYCF